MANKKKQVKKTHWKANYLWFLPLAGCGVLFWWINGFAAPMLFVVWVLIALSTFAVIRGESSSFSALAALYVFAFIACYLLLGIKLLPLSMSSDTNSMSLFGLMISLNILLIFAFVAYFCYKKEILAKKTRMASLSERFFVKTFWLLLGVVAAFNLYVVLTVQVSIIALVTFIAAVAGIIGMKRASLGWLTTSTILFFVLTGFEIQLTIWNPQDMQSAGIVSMLCTFIVILLAYMLGRTFILRSSRK